MEQPVRLPVGKPLDVSPVSDAIYGTTPWSVFGCRASDPMGTSIIGAKFSSRSNAYLTNVRPNELRDLVRACSSDRGVQEPVFDLIPNAVDGEQRERGRFEVPISCLVRVGVSLLPHTLDRGCYTYGDPIVRGDVYEFCFINENGTTETVSVLADLQHLRGTIEAMTKQFRENWLKAAAKQRHITLVRTATANPGEGREEIDLSVDDVWHVAGATLAHGEWRTYEIADLPQNDLEPRSVVCVAESGRITTYITNVPPNELRTHLDSRGSDS